MQLAQFDFALFDFVLASLLMGLGIGADVAIATFARASQLSSLRMAAIWIVGVSFTHTVFPMLGYLVTYFSIQLQPNIEPIIGLVAFSFIFIYLKGELADFTDNNQDDSADRQILVTLGLILAVSWDALWSGPAKSAQVIGWPELLIWTSFIVVGVLVSALAMISLRVAHSMKDSMKMSPTMHWISHWLQYTVIGYFGLLALVRYTLDVPLYWWQVVLISALGIGLYMSQVGQRVLLIKLKTKSS
ncbi:hypothetical protein RS130_13530 [Paraglaciecola aquimarina]|uniref:Manganese efflux pump MntP n=1 Tax=Paraglaciecola aquimarina TaxID=1235557 RepID=A0ABU3SXR4_9ALTE|nr:hypothetical protein [Paraglaciecola aquimarina]MDU0354805.1 hypothetical protein [Paraglaciecola aquimarina]